MKKLIIAVLVIVSFASCEKKKNYCVCRNLLADREVVESNEMTDAAPGYCAQREADHQRTNQYIYCEIETE